MAKQQSGGGKPVAVIRSTPLSKTPPSQIVKGVGPIPTAKIDSIKRANPSAAKLIGNPFRNGAGEMMQYGDDASDAIKRAMNMPGS